MDGWNTQSILVLIGDDRPGLLDDLTQVVYRHGGNVLGSHSSRLLGTVALLVHIELADDVIDALRRDVDAYARQAGVTITARPAAGGDAAPAGEARYRFTASGRDEVGMMQKVSHLMRALGINIEDVEARQRVHPVTHAKFFDMQLRLVVPEQVPVVKLREYLGQLCGEMRLEWELRQE